MQSETVSPQLLAQLPEHTPYHKVLRIRDEEADLTGFIALHTVRPEAPAFGATRFWRYASEGDALRDALRLSRLMSYKVAAAGLPYTGAKGVIMHTERADQNRIRLFEAYAEAVHSLGGRFVTGTDVGVTREDVMTMYGKTPYVIGREVDPAYFTALGVFYAIQVALEHVFGSTHIKGRRFAIQGAGKTGMALAQLLHAAGGALVITDTDPAQRTAAKVALPKAVVCAPDELFHTPVDVYCPCALGGVLRPDMINVLQCAIVAGSANNQLQDTSVLGQLAERGIVYAPDYVINLGGLVSVVDEFEHGVADALRIDQRLRVMSALLKQIFLKSIATGLPSAVVTDMLMEERLGLSSSSSAYVAS